MTKHDEIRQILHETGFKFTNSDRTALNMTDAEVEAFVVEFITRMAELGRAMRKSFEELAISVTQAMEPMRDLNRVMAAAEVQHRVNQL